MTWLLYLYPPRWRQRYGEEFVSLIASQRFSLLTVIDIIGGAIDAWTQPQTHLAAAAAQGEGETTMLAKQMRLRCAGYGKTPTMTDSMIGAAVIIGGTLLSVLIGGWMQRRSIAPDYAEALLINGWLIAFILSMPVTALKGWPMRTQAIFMGGLLVVLLGLAWINI